jgi:hypothetical protein
LWREVKPNVLLVFGHRGFNELSATLMTSELAGKVHLRHGGGVRNFEGEIQALDDAHCAIVYGDGGNGITDSEMRHAMLSAYERCLINGFTVLMTNGCKDVELGGANQEQRDHRTQFLYAIAAIYPDITTHFVSMSDCYVGNVPT